MRAILTAAAGLLASGLLLTAAAGCGLKGDLYLPEPEPNDQAPAEEDDRPRDSDGAADD